MEPSYSSSLSAGFITGSLASLLQEDERDLVNSLCEFHVASNTNLELSDIDREKKQILSVYKNIISRGFPTYSSIYVERSLGNLYGNRFSFEEVPKESQFKFELDKQFKPLFLKALTAFEPRVKSVEKPVEDFKGSKPAKEFYDSIPSHIKQFTQPERFFSDGILLIDGKEKFYRRQVDFAIETPTGIKCIIEIDGKQHNNPSNKVIDEIRDEALYESGWNVVRIPASEASFNHSKLDYIRRKLKDDETIKRAAEIQKKPLWEKENGFDALHIGLSPIAIARIQSSLIKAALSGNIDLQADKLTILVLERDVSCGLLAIEDLFHWLEKLYQLNGLSYSIPEIELEIVASQEFEENVVRYNNEIDLEHIDHHEYIAEENFNEGSVYDCIIDISVLQREGLTEKKIEKSLLKETGVYLHITSSFNMKPVANIEGANPIEYSNPSKTNLIFFLQQIFRKKDFRDGQLEILQRALSAKDTIGLLPTGGGKSLCYQLATILQPGISLIVEPLKSLMADQYRNLKNFMIDHCVYINSDIDAEKREIIEKRWARSEYQYIWISPERLQIEEFRKYLQSLSTRIPVVYAIIDEAHCVSEWGHDFRTSYLMMSKTIRKYCEYEGKDPTFYALTATASEIVLTDIVNELVGDKYQDGSPVVRTSELNREELNIKIHSCSSDEKFDHITDAISEICSEFNIDTNELFEPKGPETKAGLIFCPHVNGTDFSIDRLSSKLSQYYNFEQIEEEKEPEPPVCDNCNIKMVERSGRYGRFWGCPNYPKCEYTEQYSGGTMKYYDRMHMYGGKPVKGFDKGVWDEYKMKAQEDFVDDKVPLMVSTKAFGMGIDKPNIYYTIHYNIPSSLEAFYQEAGRAGRGEEVEKAINTIIFSDDSLEDAKDRLSPRRSADEVRKMEDIPRSEEGDVHRMLFFQKNSFKGFEEELDTVRDLLNHEFRDTYQSMHQGQSKKVVLKDKGNNTEKAIYRLSLIGFVEDYTIDFSYPRVYNVTIGKRSFDEHSEILRQYIKKHGGAVQEDVTFGDYMSSSDAFREYVSKKNQNHFLTKCCAVLLEYIYATIEPQRRRALLNLVDALESGDPEKFRSDMLRYLNPDEVFNRLFKPFPDEDTRSTWEEILENATDEDKRQKLLGITLRNLESYPSNIGLLFLAAVLRLSLPGENPETAIQDFETAFSEFEKSEPSSRTQNILKLFLSYLIEHGNNYPNTVLKIVRKCSEFLSSDAFDIWLYQKASYSNMKKYAAGRLTNSFANKTEKLIAKLKA